MSTRVIIRLKDQKQKINKILHKDTIEQFTESIVEKGGIYLPADNPSIDRDPSDTGAKITRWIPMHMIEEIQFHRDSGQ